jgi:hypothetical protein
MKKLLLVLSFSLAAVIVNAQENSPLFIKGTNNIGIGFGIGGAYGLSGVSSQSPAFGLHYDRGIVEAGGGTVGVGGFLGYKSLTDKYYAYKQHWNYFIVGLRGTYHYDVFEVPNLDTYAGLMIAYYALNYKDDFPYGYNYNRNYAGRTDISIFAGAKYYFAPNVAAFGEVGYGVSWLTLGVAFKF